VPTWEKCSNAFLTKFLPLGKTNALRNKIFLGLSNSRMKPSLRHGNACRIISRHGGVVHHAKLLPWVDSLNPGAYRCCCWRSIFSLSIEEARQLVENMASNQSWDEEHTQPHTDKVHHLEEVDMLTAKIDLLMKKLENSSLDHLKMLDARITCEECREIGHLGTKCPTVSQDVNFIGNSNNGFHSSQGFNAAWNKPSFAFNNCQQGGMGQNFNRNEPCLRDIIRDQVRINDEIGKMTHATDKLLENINVKMESFTVHHRTS
jgi:hypothetical protein